MPPAQNAILVLLYQTASQALKTLLENKHLYQSVNINPANIAKEQIEQELNPQVKQFLYTWSATDLPKMRFTLVQQQTSAVARVASLLTLTLPHPGLYCGKCERREAFAPVWFQEVSNEISLQMAAGVSKQITLPGGFQMFFLLYQCQHCLGTPEGFLVRRIGWNLGLHGRSP